MTITDILTLSCSVFLIWRGYSRGFLSSIIGPLAMMIGYIISILYFMWTNNMAISLCLGLFITFVLSFVLRFFLRSWMKITNPNQQLSSLSRTSGAFLSWLWGMIIIGIAVVLIATFMPPVNKPFEIAAQDTQRSVFYHILKPLNLFATDKLLSHDNDDSSTPLTTTTNQTMNSQEDIKSLQEDSRIQGIINDETITEAIKNKDYSALLSNPKILELIKDPTLMKKMLSLNQKMKQEQEQEQEKNQAQPE